MDLFDFTNQDELTNDHVFYYHLQKRDNMISELYGLFAIRRVTRLDEIKYEDTFLTEFLKAREIFESFINRFVSSMSLFSIETIMFGYKPFFI